LCSVPNHHTPLERRTCFCRAYARSRAAISISPDISTPCTWHPVPSTELLFFAHLCPYRVVPSGFSGQSCDLGPSTTTPLPVGESTPTCDVCILSLHSLYMCALVMHFHEYNQSCGTMCLRPRQLIPPPTPCRQFVQILLPQNKKHLDKVEATVLCLSEFKYALLARRYDSPGL